MPGGDSELLLLMTNPKLPGDTRIILVNPRWCLEIDFADHIADTVQRQSHLAGSLDWTEFNGQVYNTAAEAAKARFLSMNHFEAEDPHVHMKGRENTYKNTDDVLPTPLCSKLVQCLKSAYSRGHGDVVYLAKNYDYEYVAGDLSSAEDMHMTAFTVAAARKMHATWETEIRPILEDVKAEDQMHIGLALKRFEMMNLDWHADISFAYMVPTFGHVINFKNPIIQPIPKDFNWARIEHWAFGWVGNLSMWESTVEMPHCEIFEMQHSGVLKFVVRVELSFPLEPHCRWITYIDPHHLQPKSHSSVAESLTIDGVYSYAYDLPHPTEVFPEQDLGFRDFTNGGENPTKKMKRGFRSGRTRYKNRVWTCTETKAASLQGSFRCCFRFVVIQMVLLLFSKLDEHRAFQMYTADTGVDGNLTSSFLLSRLFPWPGAGMSTVPSSPTHKDNTFYCMGLPDS